MKEFDFKKKYGQNFLVDKNIVNKIVEGAEIDKDTLVIEVGPGAGALTVPLALKAGRVISFEIDESLKDILSSKLNEYNNVEVIYGDFLKSDVNNVLKKYNFDLNVRAEAISIDIFVAIANNLVLYEKEK